MLQPSTPVPAHDRSPQSPKLPQLRKLNDELPLATIIYRSKVTQPLTAEQITELLREARARNRSLSITGMLVYDGGCFFQWFEGPSLAVAKLWTSIQRDPRHHDVQLVGRHSIDMRLFGDWEMRLAYRFADERGSQSYREDSRFDAEAVGDTVRAPTELIDRLHIPDSLLPEVWTGLAQLRGLLLAGQPDASEPLLESIDLVCELAARSVVADPEAATSFVDSLLAQGLSAESICLDLFEPAARHLGALWSEDACSEMDVTVGVCRLQALTRHLGASFRPRASKSENGRSVLVATQPGEPHMLGVGLASQFFWQAGWNVACDFPASDEALCTLLNRRWFDLLDLSFSNVFSRDHRLLVMAKTITLARAASQNRSLVVLVNGRVFLDRPELAVVVGANAAYSRIGQAVSKANRQFKAPASKAFMVTQQVLREVECRVTEQTVQSLLGTPI